MKIEKSISLQPYNTFGIDVNAKLFCAFESESDLSSLLTHEACKEEKKLILGGGSNLLFTSDFDGLVMKNDIRGIETLKEDDDHIWVRVGAGENWHEFVLYCIQNQWGGVENLSLIPGTVGAAPMQNIGAYGVEIKEVFESLEAIQIEDGISKTFSKEDCQFGYRESIFKKKAKGQFIITRVTLRLSKKPEFNTSYGAIGETLNDMGIRHLSIKAISDAVIKIRQSKLPDPDEIGNAGSFFKNPTVDYIDFEGLRVHFPKIPGYELPGKNFKIPAAWLIEQCGWKGRTFGPIGVHKNQALVLVNYGQGTGGAIKNLAMEIKESVARKFGIEIEPEVNIV
ncbi:MAG: UDP-N-acetylmuramate dehydrogenase [Cytophagales bacterium]|nr:UDP-N-acetylmuramate dehydrogenase [Cytophagales bacterium]